MYVLWPAARKIVRKVLGQMHRQLFTFPKLTHIHSCRCSCEGGDPPVRAGRAPVA